MSDSYVQVAADSSGKKIDNEFVTVGANDVYRQRVEVAGKNPTDIANVTSSGGLDVNMTGGSVSISSLSSATVYQGTSPWVVVASSTGGPQQVVQSASPWVVVASTTGGNQPVTIQNTLPLSVVASTTGGNVPVILQNTLPLLVVASTTGGSIPVATHAVTQGTTPWQTIAATSGGAQPVAQSTTPWLVVCTTTGSASGVPVTLVPGAGQVIGRLVGAKDRLRVKNWNSISQLQYKLVGKFLRRSSDGWSVHTVSKIVSPGADRGTGIGAFGASWPFGAASTFGTRTVTDAIVVAGSSSLTSATAVFTSSDIGISITIAGAAVADITGGTSQPSPTPDGTYQGNIVFASSGSPTAAQIYPLPGISTSSGKTMIIDPPLLSEEDGLELGDGILIGCDANYWYSPTNIRRGQLFVECELLRGYFGLDQGITLFRGYMGTGNHLAWPNGPLEHSIAGEAYVQTQAVASPAVGTDWTVTVPTNARWQILEVSAVLSASSGASARLVAVLFDDPTNITNVVVSPVSQTSGQGVRYNMAASMPFDFITPPTGNLEAYMPLSSPGPFLSAGHRLRTSTANLGAGDQWSSIVIRYKEWMEA